MYLLLFEPCAVSLLCCVDSFSWENIGKSIILNEKRTIVFIILSESSNNGNLIISSCIFHFNSLRESFEIITYSTFKQVNFFSYRLVYGTGFSKDSDWLINKQKGKPLIIHSHLPEVSYIAFLSDWVAILQLKSHA